MPVTLAPGFECHTSGGREVARLSACIVKANRYLAGMKDTHSKAGASSERMVR